MIKNTRANKYRIIYKDICLSCISLLNFQSFLVKRCQPSYSPIGNRTKQIVWELNIQSKTVSKNRQFFFIEPLTEQAKQFVLTADFEGLALRNTSTPGFGKADFVSYYLEWLGEN